jgi:quinohemoprotein ethanol dehydrogenase
MANGGTLATAGDLVFQGTIEGRFLAYSARSGETLWSFDAGNGIIAGPVSYAVGGVQYVAVLAGKGGAAPLISGFAMPQDRARRNGRVLAFRLDGKAMLPPVPPAPAPSPPDLSQARTTGSVTAGARLYADHCMVCHGAGAISGGVLPDLRYSAALGDTALWKAIVIDGALAANGMVSFAGRIEAEQVEDLRAWVVSESRRMSGER